MSLSTRSHLLSALVTGSLGILLGVTLQLANDPISYNRDCDAATEFAVLIGGNQHGCIAAYDIVRP
jgi:hypothetical protein